MTIRSGSSMILSVHDGGSPGSFLTVGGLRVARFTSEAGPVAVNNLGSGAWRSLAAAVGDRRITLEGEGVFTASSGEAILFARACDQALLTCRLILPDAKKIEGSFQVSRYRREGARDDSIAAALTLTSSGTITVLT